MSELGDYMKEIDRCIETFELSYEGSYIRRQFAKWRFNTGIESIIKRLKHDIKHKECNIRTPDIEQLCGDIKKIIDKIGGYRIGDSVVTRDLSDYGYMMKIEDPAFTVVFDITNRSGRRGVSIHIMRDGQFDGSVIDLLIHKKHIYLPVSIALMTIIIGLVDYKSKCVLRGDLLI